jgi:hypothetical protein
VAANCGRGKIEKRKWKSERINAEFAESAEYTEKKREETPFGRMAFPGVAGVIARVCGVW